MSSESSASRLPLSNSAKSDSGPDTAERDSPTLPDHLPRPEERVEEFLADFGDVAYVPLSTEPGRELRAELTEEVTRTYEVDLGDCAGTDRREEVLERTAVPWVAAVEEMLEWHADYHRSQLSFEYGTPRDYHHEIAETDLDNSWMVEYQEQERARLKAMERETVGFESCAECSGRYCEEPDEHATEWVEGAFERPVAVLTTRTAAGDGRPPVDHAREISDGFSHGGVRRSLRYVMDKLGLSNEEWVRWTQAEPHPGGKAGAEYGGNTGYHHAHDVIILDAAAADGDVTAATFRPVIDSHVRAVEAAGPLAHDLEKSCDEWRESPEAVETVEVKHAKEDIQESVASYAASYLANEEADLLERETEYIAWAASMWATNTRKATGTDSRTHAITADRCHHEHAVGDQDAAHGEEVCRSRKRGYSIECFFCGSPWRIDQEQTLASARLSDGPEAVADGGQEVVTREEAVEEELRDRWPSARAAATVCQEVGESPAPAVSASFERSPEWSVRAVVWNGEEKPPGGGGLDRRPLKPPGANLAGLPDTVRTQETDDATLYVCTACSFRSFDAEMLRPDGHGHAGGNGQCEACDGVVPEEEAIRPDVPLMWPEVVADGSHPADEEECDVDHDEPGDGADRAGLAEHVRRYLAEENLDIADVDVPTVAGGLLARNVDAPPEEVEAVLADL